MSGTLLIRRPQESPHVDPFAIFADTRHRLVLIITNLRFDRTVSNVPKDISHHGSMFAETKVSIDTFVQWLRAIFL